MYNERFDYLGNTIQKKEVDSMVQHYYCKHCLTIHTKRNVCPVCGKKDHQAIIISVHSNVREKAV